MERNAKRSGVEIVGGIVQGQNRFECLAYLKCCHDGALQSFDRALGFQPEHVEVLNNRAGVLQEIGRYDEALEGYDRALALRPDHPETLNNRGVTLQVLGRHGADRVRRIPLHVS